MINCTGGLEDLVLRSDDYNLEFNDWGCSPDEPGDARSGPYLSMDTEDDGAGLTAVHTRRVALWLARWVDRHQGHWDDDE